MKRLVLVACAIGASFAVAPHANAVGCPNGWYHRPTGLYSPVTGTPVTYCWPMS
jgi:hypothetical protein